MPSSISYMYMHAAQPTAVTSPTLVYGLWIQRVMVWPGLWIYAGCPSLAPYPQRIVYRISALVRRCMEGLAPFYLRELCCSTVTIQRRISLRSSAQAELL